MGNCTIHIANHNSWQADQLTPLGNCTSHHFIGNSGNSCTIVRTETSKLTSLDSVPAPGVASLLLHQAGVLPRHVTRHKYHSCSSFPMGKYEHNRNKQRRQHSRNMHLMIHSIDLLIFKYVLQFIAYFHWIMVSESKNRQSHFCVPPLPRRCCPLAQAPSSVWRNVEQS